MNATTISINVPELRRAPRGALFFGALFAKLLNGFDRATLPAAARDVAQEAAATRALAQRYAHFNPGFAADLFAAADRHEAKTSA